MFRPKTLVPRRRRSRWLGALAATLLLGVGLAAVGGAADSRVAFKCGDPKLRQFSTPLGTRGYLTCSDGATAVVKYKGATYRFGAPVSGVCWKDSKGRLTVDIGAIIPNGRKATDKPGFHLGLVQATGNATHSAGFGLTVGGKVVTWAGPIAFTKTGANGETFKDAKLNAAHKWVESGKIASGSWSCKRVFIAG